ncbi:magnesium transporter CorA family protein [Asticcacaulis excentricus]|uniref:Magnesium transport protein CorA n=1 Tax=Asticcacaulis excentricus (strain ATCC 15261 / DSM 4724 / KCTC 12464 / NCIMB 9791 / VKM B-1370 / CB 48) TaxID=573065 RepID=E8RND7_ASTEC|nr:magnesium transporter CorA family protein [Asticcacaulis excentricus]ADU11768.1 Mg2 transporter protein CorA family protein [Asticcacaulis excentricus CB 48]
MITIFHRLGERIAETQQKADQNVPDEPVWIDLFNPTEEELRHLPQNLNIALPTREETWRNHALNRMYTRDGTAYMTAAVISDDRYARACGTVTFILTPDFLITLRDIDPPPFLALQERLLLTPKAFPESVDVLTGLLEAIVLRTVVHSDEVISGLDGLSRRIFSPRGFEGEKGTPSDIMHGVLQSLGLLADLNSRIHESISSLQRVAGFLRTHTPAGQSDHSRALGTLLKDTQSIAEQTTFLSNKISFQLDAALGMINVEQNQIGKIFSTTAVFFLPPALVAGIYGMNFDHMPELHWALGYPLALGLMGVAVLVPYWVFKRRGWL